ncbi:MULTISPECIES: thiamine ABC transporter substrate-binding protein [unclassified Streptomyces]|uniref:thiamine ABC transporter substrate-binding protein n=1 Tax=unclassified Streptomyces TaxID=2593676 RepID=UPI000DBA9536|nr:thiamine ABC transporter substrate-binding protein [Streptomyces sp. PsTaAH-137]MYT73213.1 thiamine ABC transporter substrate-binding protein [Streptomyces sp. SID8367]RAJ74812.1 thiamine transport system substrate-binding protein [Streptomyces sp. PsTaAH-137]
MSKKTSTVVAVAVGLGLVTLSACGSSSDAAGSGGDSKTVTLVSHDSWAVSKSVLADFEKSSGYRVKVLKDGDAGEAVNKAILSKGNPQGDVFFGVDNTLLSRALDNGVFASYKAKGLSEVKGEYQLDGRKNRVTPIDTGSICVNYDKKYFAQHHLTPPASFDDLTKAAYKNLLVTENASTSSPGLGFLLGTAAEYGDDGWQAYWKKLKVNGVKVVDGWEQAYNEEFSGSAGGRKAGGERPLVVSYASSPPAEAIYADPQPKTSPVGVAKGTCFRQIEFAGLLDGAKNGKGGQALIDFLISKEFQQDMPLNMFVDPVTKNATAPAEYTKYAVPVDDPETMAPRTIADHRDDWVKSWTSLVLK